MTCSHCATVLPSDALFCGECGRAVTHTTPRSVLAGLPPLSSPVPPPEPWMNASAAGMCEQCGLPVTPDDIFCGECGFVVGLAAPARTSSTDTNVIDRLEKVSVDELMGPGSDSENRALPMRDPELIPELIPELKGEPKPEPMPEEDIDVESTRIASHPLVGTRFVLQFSTGESFTVYGSGLVGRSPKPEPSEFFDQMIRIVDASRSVSKTHIEFGQEGGSFWVKDRFSGNGTIVREPESPPVRCHPERRYRLVRGSRVDLGEQFFIVS